MYPFINIFSLRLPSYGLCIFFAAVVVCVLAYLKGRDSMVKIDDIVVTVAIGLGTAVFFGCILYLIVTYSIPGIISMISKGDFSFMKNTGIVFYGGLAGGVLGVLVSQKITKMSIKTIEELFVPFVPLGHAIGRVGCTLAGCCHGMEYEGPFALHYPNAVSGLSPEVGYFPVQLLEAGLDVIICICLVFYSKKERKRFDILFTYLFMYAIMRFITECFRGDAIRGVYFGISTSQWISIGLVILCAIRWIISKKIIGNEK